MVSKNELGKEDILESPSKEEAERRRSLNQDQLDKNIAKEAVLVMQENAVANILNAKTKVEAIKAAEAAKTTGISSESKKITPGRLNIQGDNWMNRNKNTGQTV